MEELIPIASKLQDVLGALGQNTNLDLPQIVVIGGQSSGKSSVLESVVGRSFLPRGTGIVTRRPLVLQLFNTASPVLEEDIDDHDGIVKSGNGDNDDDDDDGAFQNGSENDNDERKSDRRGGRSGRTTNKSAAESSSSSSSSSKSKDRADPAQQQPPSSSSPQQQEWGEFLHQPGKRYYDFAQIRDEISRDTNRLAGLHSKGVSPTPIHLKIYSPNVLSLTMVDLPGLTKVAIRDQPEDIEEQIYSINCQYGSNPNAILLAVTSANTDLASSDALKLARQLDPRGERTIGVLTKLDLMDPGTDASEILHNRIVPLRRGYVAVVNRGQRDIDADLSIRVGLRNEERFFRTHPVYSRDRSVLGKCGTINLARNLNSILIHHIRECLPELKIRIANMMIDVQSELDALGMPEGGGGGRGGGHGENDPGVLGGKLLGLLSKFSSNFAAMIDGRASNTNQHHDGMPLLPSSGGGVGGANMHMGNVVGGGVGIGGMGGMMGGMALGSTYSGASNAGSSALVSGTTVDELYGGARISYIFHQVFGRSLNSVGAFDGLSEDEIRTTIGNANGTRPALFVPEISFDILVRRQIRRLEQPGVQCVDLVYDELQRIAAQSEPTELTRYPNLRDRMMDVVSSLLKRSVGPTQMWVSNLVRIELSYINTNHPDFIGGSRAVARLMEKMSIEKEAAARKAAANEIERRNGIMTPVRERVDDSPDVGATPLTSSSLERYMDDQSQQQHGAPPQHVVVDRSMGGSTNNAGGDASGGIMNFIFRGGANPPHHATTTTATGGAGMNRADSWNNRVMVNGGVGGGGGGGNGRSSSSHYCSNGSVGGGMMGGYVGGGGGGPPTIVQLPQVPDTMRQTDAPPSDRERVETEIIKSLIDSYFSIVRKNYIDMVPKTIMYFLVNHVKDEIQNELVSELYRESEVKFLMKEAKDIAMRRRTCLEMRDLLEKALEIVNEVRDFNTFSK
jgi:dynamin 1-like protein